MSVNALEVNNLRKAFGNLKAVNDVSFEVKKGEILGFLGPNGAGKTTLISLIIKELKKDAGDIRIYDCPIYEDPSVLDKVGVCTQELQLWPLLTCKEHLVFMGKIYGMDGKKVKKRADDLLEMIGLQEKSNTLSKRLSGGMKRRLHLIMAMVHDPDLLILDEPEAGLDPQSKILVRDFIQSLAPAKTILLTTHNMDEAERLSDRVAIMDKGVVLQLDTPETLRKKLAPEDALDIIYDKKVKILPGLHSPQYVLSAKDETLTIVGENLIKRLPEIMKDVIEKTGKPLSFGFRRSSLEDVFIKITGRGLRE